MSGFSTKCRTTTSFRGELVVGLVAPLGTRIEDLEREVVRVLGTFGFESSPIRLSALLPGFPQWREQEGRGEAARIGHLQAIANEVRQQNQDGGILARAVLGALREERARWSGNPDTPADGRAYILSQLKHPDEVELLRRVYGPAFLLLAGHAARHAREAHLAKQIAISRDEPGAVDKYRGVASDLIEVDQRGLADFGQNIQDTFPLADVFVDLNLGGGEYEVGRYLDLEFGHPFHTPTAHEVAMYQASSVALRSSDYNRQVGAAIVHLSEGGPNAVTDVAILAIGMNEVPKGGGGFYWTKESPDCRDQALGDERASQIKVGILAELVDRMAQHGWLSERAGNRGPGDVARDLLPQLARTQFVGIGEFSRPVHAEVAAIIDAARRGVSIAGSTLYVTTFPCHNCAKHIIAAGITKVIYLEPYPKSRAGNLYEEEIILDSAEAGDKPRKVVFHVYGGIAPRKYRTLFSMAERGARQGLDLAAWHKARSTLRPIHVPPFLHAAYALAERDELAKLGTTGTGEARAGRGEENGTSPSFNHPDAAPQGS